MIRRSTIREAEARAVTVNAAVLLEFVRASQQLHQFLHHLPAAECPKVDMAQWEIAHATLCGAINERPS